MLAGDAADLSPEATVCREPAAAGRRVAIAPMVTGKEERCARLRCWLVMLGVSTDVQTTDGQIASHSTQDTRAMRRPMQTISPIVGHRQETVGDRPLAEG